MAHMIAIDLPEHAVRHRHDAVSQIVGLLEMAKHVFLQQGRGD